MNNSSLPSIDNNNNEFDIAREHHPVCMWCFSVASSGIAKTFTDNWIAVFGCHSIWTKCIEFMGVFKTCFEFEVFIENVWRAFHYNAQSQLNGKDWTKATMVRI